MELHIGTTNVEESNDFLRCLWAEMAREFDNYGWHYTPDKYGNRITFGFLDINQKSALEVGITYKKKGSINNIFFLAEHGNKDINKGTELYIRLKKVINTTKRKVGHLEKAYYSIPIKSYHPLMVYRTENFATEPMDDAVTKISFGIKAYDKNQANGYIYQKVNQIMNFLTIETNSVFELANLGGIGNIEVEGEETFQEADFIDGHSVIDGFYVISEEGKQFIKLLTDTDQELTDEVILFLKACSHFHSARKQEKNMLHIDSDGSAVVKSGGDETELATTLYLSALEVATLIGFKEEKCDACGQPKFQISRRVKGLVSRYLPKHLVKNFIDYYDKRSKFLHAGLRLNTETPTSSLIPLLDPNDVNGCDFPAKVSLINIREYVSYCLRNFYKENLL